MQELSARQAQVLAFISARMPYVGLAPSDHEIMAHHGFAVRAAYQHVRALQRKGVFSSTPHHRNIRLSLEHVHLLALPLSDASSRAHRCSP